MLRKKRQPAPKPDFGLIQDLQRLGYTRIVGLDEVGRGALAGPLIVAAVELPVFIAGITDSKLLSAQQRIMLAEQILRLASQIRLGWASVVEINQLGLASAQALAYERAIEQVEADLFLTDFTRLSGRKFITQAQGDRYFYPVGAASIVAKVYRDQLMKVYYQAFPHYGWEQNAGYGTAQHRQVMKERGVTALHRNWLTPR